MAGFHGEPEKNRDGNQSSWGDVTKDLKEGDGAAKKSAAESLKRCEEFLEISPLDVHNVELLDQVHPLKWKAPEPLPVYNMVAIGAGAGGLVTAAGSTRKGATAVALIEKKLMGGDCLNIGCVPSKALLSVAKRFHHAKNSQAFGITVQGSVELDFGKVMERMRVIRTGIAENDSHQRFAQKLGVDMYFGHAKFISRDTIEVAGKKLRFRKACIATGGRARVPKSIPGLESVPFRTNATIFNLTELPKRLVVVGTGAIGCELGQAFARFGSQVTVINARGDKVMSREDPDAAQIVQEAMASEGIEFELGVKITQVAHEDGVHSLSLTRKDGTTAVVLADELLLSVGRVPNVENLGLEAAGVKYTSKGITVDDNLRTSNANVFSVGDCALPHKFTHISGTCANMIVVENALCEGKRKYSEMVKPWCTYTEPEVAHVGAYERELKEGEYLVFRREFSVTDRAITDSATKGFVKVFTEKGSDKILGATICGAHAGEMISAFTLSMHTGRGALDIASIIVPYPTLFENVKFACAGYRGRLPSQKEMWGPKLKKELDDA